MYTIHMYLSSDTCLPGGEIRREAGNRKQAGKVATFSRGNVDISGTPVEEKQVVEQARKEFRRKGKGRGGVVKCKQGCRGGVANQDQFQACAHSSYPRCCVP